MKSMMVARITPAVAACAIAALVFGQGAGGSLQPPRAIAGAKCDDSSARHDVVVGGAGLARLASKK